MPVSPALAENLAAEVVGTYQEAERQLLERISHNLAKGIDGPKWVEEKRAQLLAYQRQTEALIVDLQVKAASGVTTAITDAYERGGLSAVADIAKMRGAEVAASDAAEKAMEGKWWPSPDNQFRWAIVRNGEVETVFASKDEAQSFARKYMKGQTRTYVRQNFNEMAAVADAAKQAATVSAVEPLAGLRAVEAMAAETLGYVNATHPRILRSTMDAYRAAIEAGSKQAFVGSMERVAASEAARDIVAENAQQVLLGAQTRRQATQAALDAFAKKGITGFIDKSGRGWNLESYVEMAMRSGCGKAAVQGHVDRLVENGLDLVIVSDAPRECPLCRPWEGKVLSIGGVPVEMPEDMDSAFQVENWSPTSPVAPTETPQAAAGAPSEAAAKLIDGQPTVLNSTWNSFNENQPPGYVATRNLPHQAAAEFSQKTREIAVAPEFYDQDGFLRQFTLSHELGHSFETEYRFANHGDIGPLLRPIRNEKGQYLDPTNELDATTSIEQWRYNNQPQEILATTYARVQTIGTAGYYDPSWDLDKRDSPAYRLHLGVAHASHKLGYPIHPDWLAVILGG